MRSNMDTKQVAQRSSLEALQRRSLKREKSDKKLSRSIKKIRTDMVEISEGQKRVREGQMEVRKRFQEISKEAAKHKEETSQISKQSAADQLRLDLMFQFIKARAGNDWMLQEQRMMLQEQRMMQHPIILCSCFYDLKHEKQHLAASSSALAASNHMKGREECRDFSLQLWPVEK